MTWQTLAIAEVFLMMMPANTFPIAYAALTRDLPWHRSAQGRSIMALAVGLALLVDFAVLYNLFPHAPARPIVASFVYGLILFGLVSLNVSLFMSWRDRNKP